MRLEKKLKLRATTSTDSTLVAGGDVKRTKKQLAAGEPTKFTAMLTQSKWKQLKEEKDAPKPVVDTDEEALPEQRTPAEWHGAAREAQARPLTGLWPQLVEGLMGRKPALRFSIEDDQ